MTTEQMLTMVNLAQTVMAELGISDEERISRAQQLPEEERAIADEIAASEEMTESPTAWLAEHLEPEDVQFTYESVACAFGLQAVCYALEQANIPSFAAAMVRDSLAHLEALPLSESAKMLCRMINDLGAESLDFLFDEYPDLFIPTRSE